jgi:hypothetical protein
MSTPRHAATDTVPRVLSWLTPTVRTWLYAVVLAVVALLGGYGLISEEMIPLWVALAAAILGTSTALAHHPSGGDAQ